MATLLRIAPDLAFPEGAVVLDPIGVVGGLRSNAAGDEWFRFGSR